MSGQSLAEELLEFYGALRLRRSVLWLDSVAPRPLSFVSHALCPGAQDQQKIVCTEPTAALLRGMAEVHGRGRRAHQPRALITPYGRPFKLGQLTLELLPAGTVLGGASLLVETRGKRLVYAGEVNPRKSPLARRLEARPCDLLVLPPSRSWRRHTLPPAEEVAEGVAGFVRGAIEAGECAVLLCAPVGEAQEAARLLLERGIEVHAHRQIAALCRVYREAGHAELAVHWYEGGASSVQPQVLLWPLRLHRSPALGNLPRRRTALVSAGALEPGLRGEVACEGAFPLSTVADYPGLLEFVRASAPREVVLLWGEPCDLQQDLRGLGLQVSRLSPPRQLELF